MKNLSTLENTTAAINKRWDLHHPNKKLIAAGQGNNGKTTILAKKIDKTLIRQLVAYSKFMLLLPDLDFSKK